MIDKHYTGIGSRNAPTWALEQAKILGKKLAECDYILRSGAAEGMDVSFEKGCDLSYGKKQIFLPWRNFNNHPSPFYQLDPLALEMAKEIHPAWDKLSDGAKKLHARNIYQVLGLNLDHPSRFILCYTPWDKGGTLQAIRLAKELNIPVYNLIDFYDYNFGDGDVSDLVLKKILVIKYKLKTKNKFYCKLFNNYRYNGKCTEMGCEFCDSYYSDQRKKWWYHPESNSYVYDSYKNIKNFNEPLEDVDDKIQTRVVNIKDHEFDVYIGRGSKWGNPFRIGVHGNRKECIEKYREYLYNSEKLIECTPQLKNKRLGCYCSPEDCHGDVIAELVENL